MFITFEGGEGSGKSTAAHELWKRLARWRKNVVLTREPGGTEIAEKIRDVLVAKESKDMDIRTEVLLYAAARREHILKKIQPALDEGKIVICDRFIDSSIVYQGLNKDSGGPEMVKWINQYIYENLKPDITFFMDIPPVDALKRITENNRETNHFDERSLAFHEKVYAGYQKLAECNVPRYIRIDASKTEVEVDIEIWTHIKGRLDE